MRILYGVLSQGQGHVNRASVVVAALRARGHRVSVLLSGDPPPAYASRVLGAFDHVAVPNLVLDGGRVARRRTMATFTRTLPARLRHARALARRLAGERVDLVMTDFEPLSAWAATLARVPSAGVAGQYRITRTDAEEPADAGVARAAARAIMNAWTPPLDAYFAVSFADDRPTRPHTTVVPPILDPALRARTPTRAGFHLAYLYSYDLARVTAALEGHNVAFRVYGMGARGRISPSIELCATDRETFLDDLAACDGVVLNGSFQGVCEAAALGKSVLSIPFAAQFEERFNAHQVERAGLGCQAATLSYAAVAAFLARSGGTGARQPRAVTTTVASADGTATVLRELGL